MNYCQSVRDLRIDVIFMQSSPGPGLVAVYRSRSCCHIQMLNLYMSGSGAVESSPH